MYLHYPRVRLVVIGELGKSTPLRPPSSHSPILHAVGSPVKGSGELWRCGELAGSYDGRDGKAGSLPWYLGGG